MSFFVITLVGAAVLSLLVTRPGMRILNALCPNFFDRLDWCFMTGLKDGLYEYSGDFGATAEEEERLEVQLLLPLMYASAGFALACAWLMEFCGYSTALCLTALLVGSLVPFAFGLALVIVGASMKLVKALWSLAPWSGRTDDSFDFAYSGAGADTPYTTADRLYDFACDRGDAVKSFFANPRGLMNACDNLCDAGMARLRRVREAGRSKK